MRMDYECYHLERVEDHILIVMMDRPEVANAKNTAMGLEQKEIFESWVLTAEFYDYPDGWVALFEEAGYMGDYYWTIIQ